MLDCVQPNIKESMGIIFLHYEKQNIKVWNLFRKLLSIDLSENS